MADPNPIQMPAPDAQDRARNVVRYAVVQANPKLFSQTVLNFEGQQFVRDFVADGWRPVQDVPDSAPQQTHSVAPQLTYEAADGTRRPFIPNSDRPPSDADRARDAVPFDTKRTGDLRYDAKVTLFEDTPFVWERFDAVWHPVSGLSADAIGRARKAKITIRMGEDPAETIANEARKRQVAAKKVAQKAADDAAREANAQRKARADRFRHLFRDIFPGPLLRWLLRTKAGVITLVMTLLCGAMADGAYGPDNRAFTWSAWAVLSASILPLLSVGKSSEVQGGGTVALILIGIISAILAAGLFGMHGIGSLLAH